MVHKQVIADLGLMPYLSVDCGSEFMNQGFLTVAVKQGIEVCHDSPNSRWSRDPAGRKHSVISKSLRVLGQDSWHYRIGLMSDITIFIWLP